MGSRDGEQRAGQRTTPTGRGERSLGHCEAVSGLRAMRDGMLVTGYGVAAPAAG